MGRYKIVQIGGNNYITEEGESLSVDETVKLLNDYDKRVKELENKELKLYKRAEESEELLYNYATGKIEGRDIVVHVRQKLNEI